MGIEEDAYRYAVKNAFLHEGKADVGAVVGKIIALHREEKGFDIKKAMPAIQEAVKKVNALGMQEITEEYNRFEKQGYELKPKPKREGLPAIDFAEKGEKVVTRYAPNPSGPMHFGHARQAILNHDLARKYNGKFILRFEDTDPKTKVPLLDAEKMFIEDLAWLGITADETYSDSDRFQIYYEHMRKAIELGKAYVCTCDNEQWKKKKAKGIACKCREQDKKKNAELFEKMLRHGLKEGQAVLRIKTDIKHPDPSVRDWWAAKIVDKPNHPKLKDTFVFPSYNFAAAIDDHLMGITLIIRGQEHSQNSTKQKFLYDYFGWKYPEAIHTGRVKSGIGVLSKSKINLLMKKPGFMGFDDPRLGTISSLRRRGFAPETIREIMVEIGLKTSDTNIQLEKIVDVNRKIIEPLSERAMFIAQPLQLDVSYAPNGMGKLVVDKKQFDKLKVGDVVRLRELFNVRIAKKDPLQVFSEFIGEAKINKQIVNWLQHGADIEIVMSDTSKVLGIADEKIEGKRPGNRVYLEGFGFCIVDEKKPGKTVLWFSHK
ncbi:MAG: glutamate--tRNA ligase [Candidatus Diapherotrites archaeon]|nr:glutamate--tRNA ligase [Candidatus Diapherotrites archaeon]